jgi:hypothetical protein
VDASHIGANGFAGRATVSERRRAHDRCGLRTAKPCRPGARGLCAKSCGDVAARPGARVSHLQGDGGNSASLPGESSAQAVKPLRREGRLLWLHLYAAVQILVAQPSHSGPRVPAGTRSSLRPLTEEGGETKQSSGEMSREDAKVCLRRTTLMKNGVESDRSRAPDAAQRFFSDALQSRGPCSSLWRGPLGPGSAPQRPWRCSLSGTREWSLPNAPSTSSQIATRACKKS